VARGVIKKRPRGQYDIKSCAQAIIRDGIAAKAGHGDHASSVTLSSERALLAQEQRETARMKNAITRGEYVRLDSMQQLVEADYSVIRERILTTPGKAADALTPHCTEDRAAIMEILHAEAVEALADLSSDAFWTTKESARVKAMRGKSKTVAEGDEELAL
jgi:hypothetical protein